MKQDKAIMDKQSQAQAIKKEAEQNEAGFRDKIHRLETKLLEAEAQQSRSICELKDQLQAQSRKKGQQDDLLQRQTSNMNQLVAAAKSLKERLKAIEKENEAIKTELESSQRYAKLMDEKYNELCHAEEQANLKVLTLLDDV